jgi:hypothetical protein
MAIVKVADCGRGWNPDLSPEELETGVWSSVTNMRFLNGYAQRFAGIASVFTAPSITPYWIGAYQTTTKKYWVHAGTQKVFVDDGTTRTEITRLTTSQVSTITYATTTATLTTTSAHGLSSGNSVTVYGAIPSVYNGTYTITVTGATTFNYTVASTPSSNATTPGWVIGPSAAVSNFTGTQDDRWTGGVLGGVLTMNNAVDIPVYWDSTNSLRNLTGWNSNWRCQSLVPFKNYLVALNITKSSTAYPHMVKWSHAAVAGTIPTSWDETDTTKDAGEQDLAETSDLLVDALPLGDVLAVYKERSCYEMRFVGQPFIFQFRKMPGEYGMLARGCGVNTPLGNVVLSAGDVILNTGQGMVSIADGLVRKYIFDNLTSDNYKRAFVASNPQRNEVLICFPFAGSTLCNKACVWNWLTKTWGLRDLSSVTYAAVGQIDYTTTSTWSADSERWDWDLTTWTGNEYAPNEARLMLATTTAIKAFDVGSSDDGVNALTGTLQRTGMTLDDPYTNKLVRAVYPRVDGAAAGTLSVRVGAAMTPDATPTWSSPVTFTVGSSSKADVFAQGRYLAVEFSGSLAYRVRSFDLDVISTGAY